MKKFFTVLAAILCSTVCMFGLVACNENNNDNAVKVESVTLNTSSITLIEGETYTLTAAVMPENATEKTVEWTSSDYEVARVDDGVVTAFAVGEAVITATTSNGKSAECVVTVVDEQEAPIIYTVTLHARNGVFEDGKDTYEIYVENNGKISDDIIVTRNGGYVFIGWYTDEYCTKVWDANDPVTDDITLFAGWKYLNKYESVTSALVARIKTEHETENARILSVFLDEGYLCFIERDDTGVFGYKTDIRGFEQIAGNAAVTEAIPSAMLTLIKDYNYANNSDNNSLVANAMAYRYTDAANPDEAIIYSCVSLWTTYNEGKFATNGPWYACQVKAIVADEQGKIYDYSYTVVAGFEDYNLVISGFALSEELDLQKTELGEIAADFYAEYLKELEA